MVVGMLPDSFPFDPVQVADHRPGVQVDIEKQSKIPLGFISCMSMCILYEFMR